LKNYNRNIGGVHHWRQRELWIRFSVYCKDSTDKTIIDAVKDLSAYTVQRMKGVGSK